MSRLTDLIAQAKAKDSQMGADLEREFKVLSSRLPFGLNFERHRPEAVELPQRPVRRGDKVRILPERGSTKKGDPQLWVVKRIEQIGKRKMADLEPLDAKSGKPQKVALDDIVFVAEFRDTIYPGLVSTGKVQRGGNKPFHTVINGENYHVLKALTWTHRGKVDAIYIDPPYNTGAKDWKYNNDYVEGDDLYRHSKWLAMMERRLLIAKELLNPADSVLVVTIDEKEYLRLGLLLEQIFPEARIQMLSSVINRKAVARASEFGRSDEYIYVVMFGTAGPAAQQLSSEWRLGDPTKKASRDDIQWVKLRRVGTGATRHDSPGCFYPIYIRQDSEGSAIIEQIGDVLLLGKERPKAGKRIAIWPLRSGGVEGRWQMTPENARELVAKGYVKLGPYKGEKTAVYYLPRGERERVESGAFLVVGRRADGSVVIDSTDYKPKYVPSAHWNIAAHNASENGTRLLAKFLPARSFPFPKSLYAVEDVLRFFVADKPEAVILDFFSGSGTTAHAVMRLNRQDDGRRQCISVTNNEVAADEQKALREQGLRPGDAEWEKHGICDFITKPRVAAAITGKTPADEPITGDYKFTDEFPMAEGLEENAEFFTLAYETPVAVSHHMAFARIATLLWLRAGSQGRRIDKLPAKGWEVTDAYGLLIDLDGATDFLKAMGKAKGLRAAYIVTDDERRFQALARRLPAGVEAIRLYESYLTNFAFANGD